MVHFIDQISKILCPKNGLLCAIPPLAAKHRKFDFLLFILLSCYKVYNIVDVGLSLGVIETSKLDSCFCLREFSLFCFLISINVEWIFASNFVAFMSVMGEFVLMALKESGKWFSRTSARQSFELILFQIFEILEF